MEELESSQALQQELHASLDAALGRLQLLSNDEREEQEVCVCVVDVFWGVVGVVMVKVIGNDRHKNKTNQ